MRLEYPHFGFLALPCRRIGVVFRPLGLHLNPVGVHLGLEQVQLELFQPGLGHDRLDARLVDAGQGLQGVNAALVERHLGLVDLHQRLHGVDLGPVQVDVGHRRPHPGLVDRHFGAVGVQARLECPDLQVVGLDHGRQNGLRVLQRLPVDLDQGAVIRQRGRQHGLAQPGRRGHGKLQVALLHLGLHHHDLARGRGVVVGCRLAGLADAGQHDAAGQGVPAAGRFFPCGIGHPARLGRLLGRRPGVDGRLHRGIEPGAAGQVARQLRLDGRHLGVELRVELGEHRIHLALDRGHEHGRRGAPVPIELPGQVGGRGHVVGRRHCVQAGQRDRGLGRCRVFAQAGRGNRGVDQLRRRVREDVVRLDLGGRLQELRQLRGQDRRRDGRRRGIQGRQVAGDDRADVLECNGRAGLGG